MEKKITTLEEENILLKKKLKEQDFLIHSIQIDLNDCKKYANIDFLTQLANRARFERSLEDIHNIYKQDNIDYVFLYIDLDNFKSVNDNFSHTKGDFILKEVAKILILENRAHTLIGRLGGEEFGIVIQNISKDISLKIAERIRKAIELAKFNQEKGIFVTASIGIYIPNHKDHIEDIIYKADKAMYYSKNNGKNKVSYFKESFLKL
jgi:diguanylate cyclase